MPTIFTATNSHGTRRCDSTCHNAQHPRCACVCGGRYHGKGSAAAHEQLAKDFLGDQWHGIKTELEAHGQLRIVPQQLELLHLSQP